MDKYTGVLGLTFFCLTITTVFLGLYVPPVNAIPCSPRFPGNGLTGSTACLNGAPGDDTLGAAGDKAFDLNAGNYFGFNDWRFLQLQGPSMEQTDVDVGLSLEPFFNSVMGAWSLSGVAAMDFDHLVVILKSNVSSEDRIFWSSYLLQEDAASGFWFAQKALESFSVFGRVSVAIPEPVTLSMILAGLVVLAMRRIASHNTTDGVENRYLMRSSALPPSSTSVTASAEAARESNRLR